MNRAGSLTSNPTLAAIQKAKADAAKAGANKPASTAAGLPEAVQQFKALNVGSNNASGKLAAPAAQAAGGEINAEGWKWWEKADAASSNLPTSTQDKGSYVPQSSSMGATGASKKLDFGAMFSERRDTSESETPAASPPAAPAIDAPAAAVPLKPAKSLAAPADDGRAGVSGALWRQLDSNGYNIEADGSLDVR